MVEGIGKDKEDDFKDEPLWGNSMNFLREEVSDAGESSLDAFAIVILKKSLARLILSGSITFAAD